MRCIVVDDMGPMRRTVALALRDLGFDDVLNAKNGKEAFDIIIAQHDIPSKNIELAVVDWNMAPITGLDLLKMVRKDKRTRNIFF